MKESLRLPALDTLRAFAILAVIGCHLVPLHLPALPYFPTKLIEFGRTGVDLFFVLSGFLIGQILLRDLQRDPRLDLKRFLWRRWMRTLPAYYAVLCFIAVSDYVADPVNPGNFFPTYLYFGQTYVTEMKRFSWSWSLCVEEHFYVTLPLLVIALKWWKPQLSGVALLRTIAIAGLLVSNGSRLWVILTQEQFSYFDLAWQTHYRLDGLAAGVFLATLSRSNNHRAALVMCPLAIGLLMYLSLVVNDQTGPAFGFPLVALGFGILVHFSAGGNRWARLEVPGARLIAEISYSLYLTHFIVIRFFERKLAGDFSPWMTVLMLGVCFVVGLALRYGVELPFLRLRERFQHKVASPTATTPTVATPSA